jgi:hypothetical protein
LIPGWLVNLPDWLVDASQVIGAFTGAIALVLAGVAIYRAETVAASERRIAHELEVLRGMTEIRLMPNGKLDVKAAHELMAALVKLLDRRDLPLVRVAFGLPSTQDAVRQFVRRYPHVPVIADGSLPPRSDCGRAPGWHLRARVERGYGAPSVAPASLVAAPQRRRR